MKEGGQGTLHFVAHVLYILLPLVVSYYYDYYHLVMMTFFPYLLHFVSGAMTEKDNVALSISLADEDR